MPRVCLFHWKEAEAKPLLAALKDAGYRVDFYHQMAQYRAVRAAPPDAIVIDLTRMPSMGRELGVFLRGSPKTRQVPLVYVDGEPEKVERVRKVLPDATYTSAARLRSALRTAMARPLKNPFVPSQMMDRFADRTAAQKLGIAKDSRVYVVDPPPDYARAVGQLPEGACYDEETPEDCKIALWFVREPSAFHAALPKMRRLAQTARLWIIWPKGKTSELNGNIVRLGAIDVGLVDYKICSVNETWSAMLFAVKKS